ncbi:MAG: hypothetical protein NZM37_05025 [Sandaracinaceae bacterium]|nr:hypothetical protein [Sandaracinaceae bacterium]MDW8246414.1 hypothetical protein [Sandaracinaceae bacterium]
MRREPSVRAWFCLGELSLLSGQFEKASCAFEKAMSQPDQLASHTLAARIVSKKAEVAYRIGDSDAARKHALLAIQWAKEQSLVDVELEARNVLGKKAGPGFAFARGGLRDF